MVTAAKRVEKYHGGKNWIQWLVIRGLYFHCKDKSKPKLYSED